MDERIGIIGKMHGVRLSNSPNPKKAAAFAPRPSVASPQAMRSVSENEAAAVGNPDEDTEAAGPAAGEPGAPQSSRTDRDFWTGG